MTGSKDAYRIDFTEPQRGAESLSFHLDDAFFGEQAEADGEGNGEEILGGDVTLDLEILPTSSRSYRLTFHYEGVVTVPCDRCLAPLELEVDADDEMTVEIGDRTDEENDEALILDAADPRYDFRFIIYELLRVHLPMIHSHESIDECDPSVVRYLTDGDAPEKTATDEDPRWDRLRSRLAEEKQQKPGIK